MIKQFLTVVAATIGIVLIITALRGQQSVTSSATASETPEGAARKDLPHLIERIQSNAQNFGFANEQEVNSIILGFPYQVYFLNDHQAMHYTTDMPVDQMVVPDQRWEVPVFLDGQAKGMATLAPERGRLKFVGFSSNWRLAQSLVDFQAEHERAGEVSDVRILRILPLYTTLALTQHEGQTNVTLLSDVEPGLQRPYLTDLDANQTYELEEVIPQITQGLTEARQNAPTE